MRKEVIGIMLLLLSTITNAKTIIDFEKLGEQGDGPTYIGPTYSEDGYTLTSSSDLGFIKNAYAGNTIMMFSRYANDILTLTKDDGMPFDLLEIDFIRGGATEVSFIGHYPNYDIIRTVILNQEYDSYDIGFEEVDRVTFTNGPYLHWDDIVIPEPSSLFLFGIGSLFLRKRQ